MSFCPAAAVAAVAPALVALVAVVVGTTRAISVLDRVGLRPPVADRVPYPMTIYRFNNALRISRGCEGDTNNEIRN